MAIVDHKHKNGTVYVYEQKSVWDKEKKRSRNKQTCIGKRDPDTGEIIYNRRFSGKEAAKALEEGATTVTSTVIGPTLVLDEAAKRCTIARALGTVFEDDAVDKIISLAYAVVADSGKMYHAEAWMETHACPSHAHPLTSPEISRFLSSVSPSQVESFLMAWVGQVADKKGYYCFDVTSISSYANDLSDAEWGYNRDKEALPQINLALLSGIASGLPAFYDKLAGSLPDVRTIHKLEQRLKKMGLSKITLLLDRGFLSEDNLEELMLGGTKFMMPLSSDLALSQGLIDTYRKDIEDINNIVCVDDAYTAAVYAMTKVSKIGAKRVWYHVFFDTLAKETSLLQFYEKLGRCEQELKDNKPDKKRARFYEKYFIVKETPKRGRSVKRNIDEIKKFREGYSGFWVIVTNAEKDAGAALRAYRKRNDVECHFKDLKDELDFARLRMHSDATLTGRLFVQFVALVILEQIRAIMAQGKLSKQLSVSEMFRRLGSYQKICFTGKYRPIVSTPTKMQRKVFDAFDISYGER